KNFGIQISRTNLSNNKRRKTKKHHPLVRWFQHLPTTRNTSAPHSLLWNRSFTPVSTTALRTMDEFQSLPDTQSEQVYGALCVMNVLLRKLSPITSWPAKIRELIEGSSAALELRDPSAIGCPDGWQKNPIWNE